MRHLVRLDETGRADRPLGRGRRAGATVEEPRFHPHLTGRQNLHVRAAARDRAAHSRVDGALERVGLGRRGDDKVGGYSLGMRQRLGIARYLLLDLADQGDRICCGAGSAASVATARRRAALVVDVEGAPLRALSSV